MAGQHPAHPQALPGVFHQDRELGGLVLRVGDQPRHSQQFALTGDLPLGHQCQLAVVVDDAVPRRGGMVRQLERSAKPGSQGLGRASLQEPQPGRFILGTNRPQQQVGPVVQPGRLAKLIGVRADRQVCVGAAPHGHGLGHHHAGIEGQHPVRQNEQRVDVELGDAGLLGDEVREPDEHLDQRLDIQGRASPIAIQQGP